MHLPSGLIRDDFVAQIDQFHRSIASWQRSRASHRCLAFSRPRFHLHLFLLRATLPTKSPSSFTSSFSFLVFPMRGRAEKARRARERRHHHSPRLAAFFSPRRLNLAFLRLTFLSAVSPFPPPPIFGRKEKRTGPYKALSLSLSLGPRESLNSV